MLNPDETASSVRTNPRVLPLLPAITSAAAAVKFAVSAASDKPPLAFQIGVQPPGTMQQGSIDLQPKPAETVSSSITRVCDAPLRAAVAVAS